MDTNEQLYVTDRDVFEILLSSKQRLTQSALIDLAQDRSIFVSQKITREELSDYLSTLPHDYNDLSTLIERTEQTGRLEKTTFLELPNTVSVDDVKAALLEFEKELPKGDNINVPVTGRTSLVANFEYDELDYSRTRLAQRQRKQAQIEVKVESGRTVIRMPANEKAKGFVETITSKIESLKKEKLPSKQISLSGLTEPAQRNEFFLKLINSVARHKLQTVTAVKVNTFNRTPKDDEFEDTVGEVNAELLAVVNNVALGGENVVLTDEFKQLTGRGFFIVALTWRAIQEDEPKDLIRFNVSFDDPVAGRGIKYAVRHAKRVDGDRFATSFKRLSDQRESAMFGALEAAANSALAELTGDSLSERGE